MPFGIASAPEVGQRGIHEFAQDLDGVEVIAGDFLIAGFGETEEKSTAVWRRTNVHFSRNVVNGTLSLIKRR